MQLILNLLTLWSTRTAIALNEATIRLKTQKQKRELAHFTYIKVTAKGCEGTINLFFGEECIAFVQNRYVAAQIMKQCKEQTYD